MIKGISYSLKSLLKKPFKVGILTPQYPEKGVSNKGVAIHAFYLTKELANLGAEIHIFTSGDKESHKTEYIGEGKRVIHKIKNPFTLAKSDPVVEKKFSRILFDNKVIDEIIKEHKHNPFDILHSHITLFGGLMSKYFNNLKWVHTFHSLEKNRLKFMSNEERKYYTVEKWKESAITYADALINVSKDLKKETMKNYKVKENKVFYIPNGVDTEIFHPDNTIAEEKMVAYVGRFSSEKGIDVVSKIGQKILSKDKTLKFEIVAPLEKSMPPSLEKIKKQFETLEEAFPNRFIWHKEPLSREELAKLYNRAMVYTQPSRYESFGMTALEAMACGKAVVVSNKGGLPEVVDKAGIKVSLNSELFSREILKLINDPKLRGKYSSRGTERAKHYDWTRIAKETLDLYKIISKKEKEAQEEGLKELENIKENDKNISNNSSI